LTLATSCRYSVGTQTKPCAEDLLPPDNLLFFSRLRAEEMFVQEMS